VRGWLRHPSFGAVPWVMDNRYRHGAALLNSLRAGISV